MQTKISGVIPYKNKYHVVDIFGYSTKGIPGIDIIGIGSCSRAVREKFTYISKTLELKIPNKRYVMCLDINDGALSKDLSSLRWLELPLLLLYWTLGNQLPIMKLDDCFCAGRVSVNGKITGLTIKNDVLEMLGERLLTSGEYKYISPESSPVPASVYHLPLEGLLKGKNLEIKKAPL